MVTTLPSFYIRVGSTILFSCAAVIQICNILFAQSTMFFPFLLVKVNSVTCCEKASGLTTLTYYSFQSLSRSWSNVGPKEGREVWNARRNILAAASIYHAKKNNPHQQTQHHAAHQEVTPRVRFSVARWRLSLGLHVFLDNNRSLPKISCQNTYLQGGKRNGSTRILQSDEWWVASLSSPSCPRVLRIKSQFYFWLVRHCQHKLCVCHSLSSHPFLFLFLFLYLFIFDAKPTLIDHRLIHTPF